MSIFKDDVNKYLQSCHVSENPYSHILCSDILRKRYLKMKKKQKTWRNLIRKKTRTLKKTLLQKPKKKATKKKKKKKEKQRQKKIKNKQRMLENNIKKLECYGRNRRKNKKILKISFGR